MKLKVSKMIFVIIAIFMTSIGANELLILQAGSATNGAISHSFVELYNAGTAEVNLTGYSLQYSNKAGTEWEKIDLSKSILPGRSFLILGNKGTPSGSQYLIPDGSGDINENFSLSNNQFKVALMSNTTLLDMANPFDIDGSGTKAAGYIDMVGAINGTAIDGFETEVMPKISKQQTARRISLFDSDNNAVDFTNIDYRTSGADIGDKYPKNHNFGKWEPFPVVPITAGKQDWLAGGRLLILQAYGSANGIGGATHSFVELYNNTYSEINLNGISLFYSDVDGEWNSIPLGNKKIPAKSSFLILGAKQNSAGRLQIAENSGDINNANFKLGENAFKVVLIRNQKKDLISKNPFNIDNKGAKAAGYIDMLGATSNGLLYFISGAEYMSAYKPNSQSVRRKNLVDTDNNSNDFEYFGFDVIDNAKLEICRPKNVAFGSWNPVTGVSVNPREEMFTSGLPVIEIETENGDTIDSKEIWVNMKSFKLTDPNDSRNNIERTKKDEIRGRGQGSWLYTPKKPYRIKFKEDVSLFNLAARRNWVLLAEYADPTYLINATGFYLGRNVFDHQPFTCTYQYVHVYLNGMYNGLYGLTEHRQVDPNNEGAPGRVNIEGDKGWMAEFTAYYETLTDARFKIKNYVLMINGEEKFLGAEIKYPEFDKENYTDSTNNFVVNDWNELYDSLFSQDFPENGYADLIDMNTFIDYWMVQEILRNWESGNANSVFTYKTNGKISMGPLWDLDASFGCCGVEAFINYGYDFYNFVQLRTRIHPMFQRFFEDPIFLAAYKERWNEKYSKIIAVADVNNFIDTMSRILKPAVAEDVEKWDLKSGDIYNYYGSYDLIVAKMKNWWINRVNWLNTELNKVEVAPKSRKNTVPICYKEHKYHKITLVSYGAMNSSFLDVHFESNHKGYKSVFEEGAYLDTIQTGNGGFLYGANIKLKDNIGIGTYLDTLHFRGDGFDYKVPLSFTVVGSHIFNEWDTITIPTCMNNGLERVKCSCGVLGLGTQIINALGHTYNKWDTTTATTCTAKGEETEKCSVCNMLGSQKQGINALGHNFTNWTEKISATCTILKIEKRVCSVCELEETRDVGELDAHTYGEPITISATCTLAGSITKTCSVCDYDDVEPIEIDENAHDYDEWSDWEITDSATCEVKGSQERIRICQNNSEHIDIETEDIPQLTGEECEVSILPEDVELQYGIIVVKNPANENAEFIVKTPEVSQIALSIYDNLGNVVFVGAIAPDRPLIWDLKNQNGRIVANGTYLVVVEAVSQNGTRYRYSAKLGVKK